MKKQIINVSPVQTAKVFAILYFVLSIPFVVLMLLTWMAVPGSSPTSYGVALIMPFLYLIFGFVFTAIGALVYNLVAKWVGGIEYTTIEK